jgi:hypothetical protein
MTGNPLLKRARAWKLELACQFCGRMFRPMLDQVRGDFSVLGCCFRCRVRGCRPEPTVRSPRLAKTRR